MASVAGDGAGAFIFGQRLAMAADTFHVRGQLHGNPITFGRDVMAVAAGAFFTLGIVKFFGGLVVYVVTILTFIGLGLGVAVVQRLIHPDRLPGGKHAGIVLVAFTTDQRTAFLLIGRSFLVAADAIGMVDVHHFLFGRIFQPHELGGHTVILYQVAGRTVFVLFFQRFGVLLVQVWDRGSCQFAEDTH